MAAGLGADTPSASSLSCSGCLVGDSVLHTVPNPCSVTEGRGALRQSRRLCSGEELLQHQCLLDGVYWSPCCGPYVRMALVPCTLLLPREPGSEAPASPQEGQPRPKQAHGWSKINAPFPLGALFVLS